MAEESHGGSSRLNKHRALGLGCGGSSRCNRPRALRGAGNRRKGGASWFIGGLGEEKVNQ